MKQVIAALALVAGPAIAQDHIEVSGTLSDDAFYRLVACAAPLGDDCQKPMVYWANPGALTLWVAPLPDAFLGGKAQRARAAITLALKALNEAGASVKLSPSNSRGDADIKLFFVDIPRGAPIAGTGLKWVDGSPLGGATTRLQVNPVGEQILDGVIVVSNDLSIRSYESVLLEELTQALGLMTDVKSDAYVGVSVLSQDGNRVKALGAQDKMALRRHYPPNHQPN